MAEKKKYLYGKAANGLTVRIPAGKYAQWKKAQKSGEDEDRQTRKREPSPTAPRCPPRPWG